VGKVVILKSMIKKKTSNYLFDVSDAFCNTTKEPIKITKHYVWEKKTLLLKHIDTPGLKDTDGGKERSDEALVKKMQTFINDN